MKKIIILTMGLICACTVQHQVSKNEKKFISTIPIQIADDTIVNTQQQNIVKFGQLLSDVHTSAASFNPISYEKVSIHFKLSQPATITVKIFDSDHSLMQTIVNQQNMNAGNQIIYWDGTDLDRMIVPDEAYYFTIIAISESGVQEIYDPTTFSGGIENFIDIVKINIQNQTVTYSMPEMGRVMIRVGIAGGPLLKTLTVWEPKIKGTITEYWNGRDQDNIMDLFHHPDYKMIIVYFSLPENSIITYGNKAITFRDYKINLKNSRPMKPKRESTIKNVSKHYHIPRTIDYPPKLKLSFINAKEKEGITHIKGKTIIRLDLNEMDKKLFQNDQFEICVYLDYKFLVEDEAGSMPFNWVWDTSEVKKGEHILSFNLSTYKDQVSVISRKIKVIE